MAPRNGHISILSEQSPIAAWGREAFSVGNLSNDLHVAQHLIAAVTVQKQ